MRQLIFFIFLLFSLPVFPQGNDSSYQVNGQSLSLEASQPLGEFYETHQLGIRLQYKSVLKRSKTMLSNGPGLIYGGGLGWHSGKKEAVNAFEYEYNDLFYAYIAGGIFYRVKKDWEINLNLGPALIRYAKTTRFNVYAGLQSTYQISDFIGVRAGIHLLKENGAGAIAMTALGLAYVF